MCIYVYMCIYILNNLYFQLHLGPDFTRFRIPAREQCQQQL